VEIETLEMPKASGFSAEIFQCRLKVDGEFRRYVLRHDPVDSALFVDLDNSHQAAVIAVLHAARKVPVPAILGEERDPSVLGSPFFVMGHAKPAGGQRDLAAFLHTGASRRLEPSLRHAFPRAPSRDYPVTIGETRSETLARLRRPEHPIRQAPRAAI
jgi:aminoglycoside phosphotransferase (APT) family kinase protein